MQWVSKRFKYLFSSTKGLALVAIALISLTAALWGTLSGPLVELGVKDVVVRILRLNLVPVQREGRIIMLYHAIATAVVAIEVYFITDLVSMKEHERTTIRATITIGYLLVMFFGLWFGYFGQQRLAHGLFLFGQALVFFSGMMLAAALWPWKKEYRIKDPDYAHAGGIDLERLAFFTLALATLGSALFGAIPGAYWGAGHETFLAENTIREPLHTALELGIIGHLHIMLALVGMGITLIIGRWFDFRGRLHKIAMPLMITGMIVITLAVWALVPFEEYAHLIIYVGAIPSMLAALLLVIFGWTQLVRERLAEQGIKKANVLQRLRALFHDPLKFGALWQMVFMNFNVSFVGIFMAVTLEETMRVMPARDERITLTGHWHILSTIIATIILFYFADRVGLKGRVRRWFGWLIILGSNLAFAATTVFELKRLFITELAQQRLVDVLMLAVDLGLSVVLLTLAAFMLWRLLDLLKRRGSWAEVSR